MMKGTLFLGIDPGLKGGIAVLSEQDGVLLEPMPVANDEIDMLEISRFLAGFASDIRVAYLEHVEGMPVVLRPDGQVVRKGTSGAFKFGYRVGAVEAILVALGIPYQLVRPKMWMNSIHNSDGGDTKSRSRKAFDRLFPGVDARASSRSKIGHEGMIEAALIAEYGRRVTKGLA